MNYRDLPIGQEFYIALPYEIRFKYGYPQFYGMIRGKELLLVSKVKKIREKDYMVLEGYEGEGLDISTYKMDSDYISDISKDKLIERWFEDYNENIQALKDFVNNVPDKATGINHGIDQHEEWVNSSTLKKESK